MPNYERSFAALRTFTDEHIERWGEVYLVNPQVRARGVLFETFLLAPVEILAACAEQELFVPARRGGKTRFYELLPEQRAVRLRADTQAALEELGERALATLAREAHCANGAWCEKLRHHAWSARRRAKRKLMEM